MLLCNGADRDENIIPRANEQTSIWSFMTRKFGKPRKETRQMAANTPAQTGTDAGAVSHVERDWDSIDWNAAHKNVCRLQMRIVKATKEKRWGKVKALQRLLTRSFSGKALAVRRVTENPGRKNARRGRRNLDHAKSKDESHTPAAAERVSPQTAQACIHTEEEWPQAPFRYSLPTRPEHASAVSSRIRPHCGSNGRPKLLWVSVSTISSRCHRAMLYRFEPEELSAMDTRRRH